MILAFVMSFVLVLTGCTSVLPAKDFTVNDLTITLNSGFAERSQFGFDAAYYSLDAFVCVLEEPFDTLTMIWDDPSQISSKEYAETVVELNELSSAVTEENGLTKYNYTAGTSGNDFTYFAYTYKNGDSFWLVQMACETKNAGKFGPIFDQYAKSVRFA